MEDFLICKNAKNNAANRSPVPVKLASNLGISNLNSCRIWPDGPGNSLEPIVINRLFVPLKPSSVDDIMTVLMPKECK
ncbi:hypothetical protein DERP_010955 [Dermatophagoides pteronyssinus]|uniref:Uncharacterized protein n=1 Tax=Dermatophagoides pteronyssinus TaxID=6956 RepID=A0ABQ8JVW1_DERPT|nr:hypothetical protein DERP_010955 [Dermatophagoides pteronyssinus]